MNFQMEKHTVFSISISFEMLGFYHRMVERCFVLLG